MKEIDIEKIINNAKNNAGPVSLPGIDETSVVCHNLDLHIREIKVNDDAYTGSLLCIVILVLAIL